jgi:hypothetical protein
MLSPGRVEPEASRQLLRQNMAAPTSSYLLSSYHDGQDDTGGFHDCQSWENNHMQASAFPGQAYRNSRTGTVAYSPASSMEVRNGFIMSPAGFNTRSSGLDSNVNAFHNFHGNSDTFQPWTAPAALLDSRFDEWNWETRPATFTNTPPDLHSGAILDGQTTLNQTMLTGLSSFDSLRNNGMRVLEALNPAIDELLLEDIGCCHFPVWYP